MGLKFKHFTFLNFLWGSRDQTLPSELFNTTIDKPLILCWSLILNRKLFQWVQVKNLNFILWILKLRKLPWSYYLWKFFRRLMLRNFSLWILKLRKLPWSYYLWKFFRRLMLRHGYCPRKKTKVRKSSKSSKTIRFVSLC